MTLSGWVHVLQISGVDITTSPSAYFKFEMSNELLSTSTVSLCVTDDYDTILFYQFN
jgi:hypothetical protein